MSTGRISWSKSSFVRPLQLVEGVYSRIRQVIRKSASTPACLHRAFSTFCLTAMAVFAIPYAACRIWRVSFEYSRPVFSRTIQFSTLHLRLFPTSSREYPSRMHTLATFLCLSQLFERCITRSIGSNSLCCHKSLELPLFKNSLRCRL